MTGFADTTARRLVRWGLSVSPGLGADLGFLILKTELALPSNGRCFFAEILAPQALPQSG